MSKRIYLLGTLSILILVVVFVVTTNSRNNGSSITGEYRTLSIDELATIMANQSDAYTVINVHIPYAGEIEGTDANISYNDLDALTMALPDNDAPIIVYCRSGSMSQQATENLISAGYIQVYDVPGGMNAWQSSGRQLVNTR